MKQAKCYGQLSRGSYKLEFRRQLLRRLLEVQQQIRTQGPNPHEQLIRPGELQHIRRLWRWEEQDWEDSLPKIYRSEASTVGATACSHNL